MAFPCRLVCYTLFSVHASFFAASTSPSFHRMVARAWVLIFFTAPFKFIQEFANSSDVNSECAAERFKSALISGSDSVELPLAAVAVQFADDQRGFD